MNSSFAGTDFSLSQCLGKTGHYVHHGLHQDLHGRSRSVKVVNIKVWTLICSDILHALVLYAWCIFFFHPAGCSMVLCSFQQHSSIKFSPATLKTLQTACNRCAVWFVDQLKFLPLYWHQLLLGKYLYKVLKSLHI